MARKFTGKWISNAELASLRPRNVFHRQLEPIELDCSLHRNQHILFRKKFTLDRAYSSVKMFVSADDYYKLYINGRFITLGPTPTYHFQYGYNEIDVTPYLQKGENLIALHTLYQGLINRVWQSGDQRHGMICDLVADGETLLVSDESFKVARHTAYTETGTCGYDTQFLERYDSHAPEVGFELPEFDDTAWASATLCAHDDHTMAAEPSPLLDFETVLPKTVTRDGNRIRYDLGGMYVGYLSVKARGKDGNVITVRCAQELNDDGSLRFDLRSNCKYEEEWVLSDGESLLDWFDYKAFRYAELELAEGVEILDVSFLARHYHFTLRANLRPEYAANADLCAIWELCVRTQKHGVQEVIQDCCEREKGFYMGDGCYTALAHMILSGDDSMVKKLIDDGFATSFISDTLVTCLDCSFIQEIAEFPLILVYLVLWHYRFTGDKEYLLQNYPKVTALLDAYRDQYETGGLLRNLDKWCVVEWPKNFRHGYDVNIRQGEVCTDAHVSINAYYIEAVRTANRMAEVLGVAAYRDEQPLLDAFTKTLYDAKSGLFRDGENTDHISLVGNSFVYAFGLYPDEGCKERILAMLDENGISSLSLFCTFPILMGLVRDGDGARILRALTDEGAWRRMLREGATTTFEGWGKETKWNTSLIHLTMSYAAVFLADVDLKYILHG